MNYETETHKCDCIGLKSGYIALRCDQDEVVTMHSDGSVDYQLTDEELDSMSGLFFEYIGIPEQPIDLTIAFQVTGNEIVIGCDGSVTYVGFEPTPQASLWYSTLGKAFVRRIGRE